MLFCTYQQVLEGWKAAEKKGLTQQPALKNYLDRTGWYLQYNTSESQRAAGTNGNSTVASWAYLPSFPLLNAWKPGTIAPGNMALSLFQLGGNQTRYCNWNLTTAEATAANIPNEQRMYTVKENFWLLLNLVIN